MNPTKIRHLLPALVAVLAVAIAGCGSGDDSGDDATVSAAKAELITQADALCTKSAQQLNAAVEKRLKQIGNRDLNNKDIVAIFTDITLPGLEKLYDQIGELQPPPEDAEQFQEILDAADQAIKEGEADPEKLAVLSGDKTPFDRANQLQQEFGFKVCGAADAGGE